LFYKRLKYVFGILTSVNFEINLFWNFRSI